MSQEIQEHKSRMSTSSLKMLRGRAADMAARVG